MAKSREIATVNAKAGFIFNEWLDGNLSGLLDWLDVFSGFTAIAGDIPGA